MFDLLKNTAYNLGLDFRFGDVFNLDDYADSIKEDAPLLLFYDCYQTVTVSENKNNGYLYKTAPLSFYILSPSNLTDEPELRLKAINVCAEKAVKVFKKLIEVYEFDSSRLEPVITATARELDGVHLTTTYQSSPEGIC